MPSSATEARICLVTALPFESRPLLDHFRLRGDAAIEGLRCYRRDEMLLLETGSGKLRAACAVAALLQHASTVRHVVNVGIAGGSGMLGDWHLASSVHDAGSGRRWYPHLPPKRVTNDSPATEVRTLDRASSDYRDDCLFDLELAGITAAVLHWRDSSAIQALKVVSDNPATPADQLVKEQVSALIASGISTVQSLTTWLLEQPDDHAQEQHHLKEWMYRSASRTSLSLTEQRMLKRELERYMARHQGRLPRVVDLAGSDWKARLQSALPAGEG